MNMITKTRTAIRSLVANDKTYYAGLVVSSATLVYILMTKGKLVAYERIKQDIGVDFEGKMFDKIEWVDKKGRIIDMSFEKK